MKKADGKRIYSKCERYFINFISYSALEKVTIYNSLGSAVGSYKLDRAASNIYTRGSVVFILPKLKYKNILPSWF